eukprot:gnl/MRDRNA2_/MRDRNA2_58011_c0_seq1.p1 gnl/MRDRNA2_/MRDRNA2_58011_c0~~gnl/MRDRNA2_/MRDRNA2_58011_c0_seq1.p1  ORF type:complete len:193 (-),score=31.75 gnl/MRDRNA2_/MRDRNA2_58011_c0_seq1:56-634(-)
MLGIRVLLWGIAFSSAQQPCKVGEMGMIKYEDGGGQQKKLPQGLCNVDVEQTEVPNNHLIKCQKDPREIYCCDGNLTVKACAGFVKQATTTVMYSPETQKCAANKGDLIWERNTKGAIMMGRNRTVGSDFTQESLLARREVQVMCMIVVPSAAKNWNALPSSERKKQTRFVGSFFCLPNTWEVAPLQSITWK